MIIIVVVVASQIINKTYSIYNECYVSLNKYTDMSMNDKFFLFVLDVVFEIFWRRAEMCVLHVNMSIIIYYLSGFSQYLLFVVLFQTGYFTIDVYNELQIVLAFLTDIPKANK